MAEEPDESVASVEVAIVVLEIVVSQQNLGNRKTKNAEKLFVGGHEARLADGGARLQFGEVRWAFLMAERTHPGAYGTGADKNNFFAGLALLGNLRHQLFHLREVGLLAAIGQDTGAELYDHARNVFQKIRAHKPVSIR